MTSQDLIGQFEYDRWANLLWLDYLGGREVAEPYQVVMRHILAAQVNWVIRVEGAPLDTAPVLSLDAAVFEETFQRWMAVLGSKDPSETISFTRVSGDPFQSSLEDIALHVVNHGTYHRGELRGLCRADGIEGFPETDRIKFSLAQSS